MALRLPKTMQDLCNFNGSLTQATLPSVVSTHPGTNLAYVAAVRSRDEMLTASPELAVKQLEALSNVYKFIIVDMGNNLSALQMLHLFPASPTSLSISASSVLVSGHPS